MLEVKCLHCGKICKIAQDEDKSYLLPNRCRFCHKPTAYMVKICVTERRAKSAKEKSL